MSEPYGVGHVFDIESNHTPSQCKHCSTMLNETSITIISITDGSYVECPTCHARSPLFKPNVFPADIQFLVNGAIDNWNSFNSQ